MHGNLWRRHGEEIHLRWMEEVLAGYSVQARKAWILEQDRFANPVGNSLRVGLWAVLEALMGDGEPGLLRQGLDEIVRIRAVQEMTAPEAVGFVFGLKDVAREVLARHGGTEGLEEGLRTLDRRIDGAALEAFDLYAGYREQLMKLRIRELKRNIPWAVGRATGSPPEEARP